MHYGIFVTVRLASSRLREKHLLPAAGKTMLEWLLARCQFTFADELNRENAVLVISTTPEACNDALDGYVNKNVGIFKGDVHNIPLRHLQTAKAFGVQAIVSVDGDDILCDPEAMLAVKDGLISGLDGVRTEGLPLGMNAWGYSLATLERSLSNHENDTLETGWGRLFDFSTFKTVHFETPGGDKDIRFTLDYDEDYRLFKAIFDALGERAVGMSGPDLTAYVRKQGLEAITRYRIQEYWDNFHKQKAMDGGVS